VIFLLFFSVNDASSERRVYTAPRELSEKLSCYLFQLAAVRKFKCVKYFPNFFFLLTLFILLSFYLFPVLIMMMEGLCNKPFKLVFSIGFSLPSLAFGFF